jgi:hypothetical protein
MGGLGHTSRSSTPGQLAATREAVKSMTPNPRYHRDLLEACVRAQPSPELDKIVQHAETFTLSGPDPEDWYHEASIIAYCVKNEVAMRMLKKSIARDYCAYSALKSDPLLSKLPEPTLPKPYLSSSASGRGVLAPRQGSGLF